MKKIFLLLMLAGQIRSQTLDWQIELSNQMADYTTVSDIEFDSQGNVYVVGGYVIGKQDPQDPNQLPDGAFIKKFTPSGQLLWTDSLKGGFHTSYNSLAIDNNDNIWAIGTSKTDNDPVIINGTPVVNGSFRVQYTTAGKVVSVNDFIGEGDLVFCRTENAFYLAYGKSAIGLSKYDSGWNLLWKQSVGNCAAIKLRLTNSAVIIAGGSTHMSMPCQLAKVTRTGQLLWVKDLWNGSFKDITVDEAENIYLSNMVEIYKFDSTGTFVTSHPCENAGGYALEFYNGLFYTNSGVTLGGKKINTTCFAGDFSARWSAGNPISSCCAKPVKIAFNNNNLYSIGNFGEYSDAFIYKMSIPVLTGQIKKDIDSVKIFPNPTSGEVRLVGVPSSFISIRDLKGNLVFKTEMSHCTGTIDLTFLPSGVYSYTVWDQLTPRKLVILR